MPHSGRIEFSGELNTLFFTTHHPLTHHHHLHIHPVLFFFSASKLSSSISFALLIPHCFLKFYPRATHHTQHLSPAWPAQMSEKIQRTNELIKISVHLCVLCICTCMPACIFTRVFLMYDVYMYKWEVGTVLLRIPQQEKWECDAKPLAPPQSSDCTHQSCGVWWLFREVIYMRDVVCLHMP